MTKIAMIGAGSTVFMKNILTDILLEDHLQDVNLRYRTSPKRLATSKLVAERVAEDYLYHLQSPPPKTDVKP